VTKVTKRIAVLSVSTIAAGIRGVTMTSTANSAVATTPAAAPIQGPVASAARRIDT
jgi:hypothetical protein